MLGVEYSYLSIPHSGKLLRLFRTEEEEILLGEIKNMDDKSQFKFLIEKNDKDAYSIKSYPDGRFTLGWSYLDGIGFTSNINDFSRQDHFHWNIRWI